MNILELHHQYRIIIGILLSIVLHIAIIQVGNFSDKKKIAAEIFAPPSVIIFQFVRKKKTIPKPVIIEKSEKPIVKEAVIEEVPEKIEEEVREEKIIPVITDIKLKGRRIAPKYPKRSLRLKQEGVVLINILIGINGKQQKMIIIQSSSYKLLDKAALDAVSQWDFSPTMRGNIPILSWVQVPVEFAIR